MGLWGRKEVDREVPARREQDTGVRDSFDELAIGLADRSVTRRQALKLVAAGAAGALLSVMGAREVAAAPRCRDVGEPCSERHRCCLTDEFGNPVVCCRANIHRGQEKGRRICMIRIGCGPVT
jgi:hypothetical protein